MSERWFGINELSLIVLIYESEAFVQKGDSNLFVKMRRFVYMDNYELSGC